MKLHHRLHELCRADGVQALYAFGSRAEEMAERVRTDRIVISDSTSDLDVGVLIPRGKSWTVQKKVRFAAALEDLLDVPRADVILLPEAPTFLALEAVRGELLVALDETAAAEFDLYVLRRAADLLPFERERRRMILEEGAR